MSRSPEQFEPQNEGDNEIGNERPDITAQEEILRAIEAEPKPETLEYKEWLKEHKASLRGKSREELEKLQRQLDDEWDVRIVIPEKKNIMHSVSDRRNAVNAALKKLEHDQG